MELFGLISTDYLSSRRPTRCGPVMVRFVVCCGSSGGWFACPVALLVSARTAHAIVVSYTATVTIFSANELRNSLSIATS